MVIADLIQSFEEWAPRWAAWEKDNVGLQIGSGQGRATKVLVALDVTQDIVREAIARKAELIISHHPLLFRPPTSITANDAVGRLVLQLAEHGISLFSAHTNLDFARNGVSTTLAEVLGLHNIRFLTPLKNSLAKIVVFVPEGHATQVLHAMAQAGAGMIGEYSSCSFGAKGRGSFLGSAASNPSIGRRGILESVDETRLEMISPRASVPAVVAAMKAVHPYEEVAYDVYYVENSNPNFGMGALGELPKPQTLAKFLKDIKHLLGCRALRFTGNPAQNIQTVAVCGGAGSDLISDAITARADAFVTADVRYHTFERAAGEIALVDAGHWETEHIILDRMAARIRDAGKAAHSPLSVFIGKKSVNPIRTM
jgi:dinuclear metal center YbgI/SA1388 family protein